MPENQLDEKKLEQYKKNLLALKAGFKGHPEYGYE